MRFLKSRLPAVIILAILIALFIVTAIAARMFSFSTDTYWAPPTLLDGVHSIDGGPWIETDLTEPITDHFRKIVFKGRLISRIRYMDELDIAFKNVWITLENRDGELLFSNKYRIRDSMAWKKLDQATIDYNQTYMPMAMRMPHTPGYEHISILVEYDIPDFKDMDLIFTVENPYHSYYSFDDCVSFTSSDGNGAYLRAARETVLPSLIFLLFVFFGVFLFPTISIIFGNINYKYLSFGFLCIFAGTFMSLFFQSWILQYYIPDPVLCMMIERISLLCFFISLILYCRANLMQDLSRMISGITALVFLLCTLAAIIGHLTAVTDLAAVSPAFNVLMGVIILIHIILLTKEAFADRNSLLYLLTWIPVIVSLFLDVVDQFIHMWGENYFITGFALTLVAQIVQMIFDLHRKYQEAVHYHQIQKELYEARVSIMTSQIRPHFMYNALTSIAMMCTLDPPTAQEATITFAKYLRENMDSLKQTAPVPFAQEFDHLKKYLYIEKLRFADKLNVEYDVTVTDFELPLLSVQPLVENAVKHGVGMKKKGGTVKIATRETLDAYEVIISDDGVGFYPSLPREDDGRSHVGMENTRTRLRQMCQGEIKIESTVGEGTVATIILPKEGQKK